MADRTLEENLQIARDVLRAATLDELEGQEAECLEDFKRDLDAAFDVSTAAIQPPEFSNKDWTIRSAEQIAIPLSEAAMRLPPMTLINELSLSNAPITSIPDKLYAQARAEGYEAAMRDAARIAEAWGACSVAQILRQHGDRKDALAELGGGQ